VSAARPKARHHAALPFEELPAFITELRARDSISARALELTILTASRTAEILGARWEEIDLNAKVWRIPAARMKAGREHTIPLSSQSLALLQTLKRDSSGLLFPGTIAGQPINHDAMRWLLKEMDGGKLTVHGFRSTFRDWAGDRTNYPRDVIEHALAHRLPDRVEAAYRRTTALEKRRKLMEAWAQYCALPKAGGKVVALHG
jgi:integrase